MKSAALLLSGALCLSGCATKKPDAPPPKMSLVKRFYGQAQIRRAMKSSSRAIDLSGLRFDVGSMPGTSRFPHGDESSILIAARDESVRDLVQVIITPRIGGPEPEQEVGGDGQDIPPAVNPVLTQEIIAEALQHSRYVDVELGTLSGMQQQVPTGR